MKLDSRSSRYEDKIYPGRVNDDTSLSSKAAGKPGKNRRKKTGPVRDSLVLSRQKPQTVAGLKAPKPEPKPQKQWTVLCYFAGDNDLESQIACQYTELEKVGSGEDMNILAQIDRGPRHNPAFGGKPGAVRYFVTKNPAPADSAPSVISSPELKDLGPVDSSSPQVFKDFLTYGMKQYPAKNYLIYVYGHGRGALGLMTDDTGESGGDTMSLPDFKKAVQEAEKAAGVDKDQVLLGLQSCLMGQAETAYEFKDIASRMLASQTEIHCGWGLAQVLGDKAAAGYSREEMSERFFENSQTAANAGCAPIETISEFDLTKVPQLKKAVINLEKAILNSSDDPAVIKSILNMESRSFYLTRAASIKRNVGTFYASDFYAVARGISRHQKLKDPKLKKAAASLMKAVKAVNPQSYHDSSSTFKYFNGMGVMNASSSEIYDAYNYRDLAFAKDTGWDEFNLNYAPEVKYEDMIGKLSYQTVSVPPDIAKAARSAQSLRNDSMAKKSLAPCLDKIKKALDGIPQEQSHAHLILRNIVLRAEERARHDKYYKPFFQESMAILSALEGEISQVTLAKAAENILKAGKENRETPAVRNRLERSGLHSIRELAYLTDNYNILNILSWPDKTDHEYLKEIAVLKQ